MHTLQAQDQRVTQRSSAHTVLDVVCLFIPAKKNKAAEKMAAGTEPPRMGCPRDVLLERTSPCGGGLPVGIARARGWRFSGRRASKAEQTRLTRVLD